MSRTSIQTSDPRSLALAILASLALGDAALAQGTRLLRRPAVSRELVAFEYGGDLWTVPRSGGQARRLTSTPNAEIDPRFSPDGSRLAFTATVGGNTDVYVVPVAGGEPTRLTFHPGMDAARGWSPDGSRVLFASTRETVPVPGLPSIFRLWSVAVAANGAVTAVPEVLPMPRAFTGSFSPDGRRVAYEEVGLGFAADWAQNQSSLWRHYRGGRTRPIRLINLVYHGPSKSCRGPTATTARRCGSATPCTSCPIATAPSTCSVTGAGAKDVTRAHPSRRLRRHERVRHERCDRLRAGRRSASAGPRVEAGAQAHDRGGRRLSLGADAAEEGRRHGAQRRAVADRRARRLRGPRRDLHRAGREGPAAQPDAVIGRARSQSGVVARRP